MKKAKPKKRTIKRTRKTRIKELSRVHGKANVTRRGKVKKSKKYNVKKTASRIKKIRKTYKKKKK